MAGNTRNKKVVRNIFIISLFIAILFPFINIFFIYPSFSRLIIWNTEEDAVRTGTHLASLLFGKEKKKLTKNSFPDWFINDREEIKNSLNLMKIKLFTPLGETIFSTEARDIGIINKNSYFHEIVAKGNPFSKIVHKDSKSLEGQVVTTDVAEVYVPIMDDDTFLGAFELYHDITDRNEGLSKVVFYSSIAPFVLMLGFLSVHTVSLLKLDKLDRDITTLKQTEETLRESEERFRSITHSSNDGIISADSSGQIISWNEGAESIFGYRAEEIIGSELILLMPERYREAHRMGLERLKTTGKRHINEKTIELSGLKKDGSEFPLELSLGSWRTSSGLYVSGIIRDITDRKRSEERILQLAYHDSLTGLPNRRLLIDRLKQVLSRDRRENKHAAVLFLDLDKFKSINDTMGHAVGDELLKAVSEGLEKCVREEDTLARHGGDEFIILLQSIERIEDLIKVAERVLAIFKTPFTLKEQKQFITTSIGISIYPQDGNDSETLLRNADIAMYSAKKDGSNQYKLYNQV